MKEISLIIPGRNVDSHITQCLEASCSLLEQGLISEIIYVDDHSSDKSLELVKNFPIKSLNSSGVGISAARNTGWKEAKAELIWFIDSDCIVEKTSIQNLLSSLNAENIAAVGGGYKNSEYKNFLARIIQEEFDFRYSKMQEPITYLPASNLLVRKKVLEEIGGFDEKIGASEDGELCFRILDAGYQLTFNNNSRVFHMHPSCFLTYLKKQAKHGYWVLQIARKHKGRVGGNSYSALHEHAQLILVLLFYLSLLVVPFFRDALAFNLSLLFLLFLMQIPIAISLFKRSKKFSSLAYIPFSFIRLFARGYGVLKGVLAILLGKRLASIHFDS